MHDPTLAPQTAVKYETVVQADGRIELSVPFVQGARVTVFVIQEQHEPDADLVAAAESSMAFWDNPYDDQDWNNA